MGYFSGLGDMLGVAADYKKKQNALQPPPFQGGPPHIAGMIPGAANSGPPGADDMMEMSEEPVSHGPPMGGLPGAPSSTPAGMTIGGLRESLRTGAPAGRSARPFGGYYAPSGLEGMGGQLADLLGKIRGDAQKKYGGGK